MKIIFIILSFLLVSCGNGTTTSSRTKTSNTVDVHIYHDTLNTKKSPKEDVALPETLCYGKLQEKKPADKIESNLLRQISSYNSALLLGDKESCVNYLYKDAVVYFRKYYLGSSDEEIIRSFFKDLSATLTETIRSWKAQGIDYEIVVPSFERKITYGNKIYIVFNVASTICSEKVYTYIADFDKTLGISEDSGRKWTFITVNDDTPNILRISNPEKVVDAIMGY